MENYEKIKAKFRTVPVVAVMIDEKWI